MRNRSPSGPSFRCRNNAMSGPYDGCARAASPEPGEAGLRFHPKRMMERGRRPRRVGGVRAVSINERRGDSMTGVRDEHSLPLNGGDAHGATLLFVDMRLRSLMLRHARQGAVTRVFGVPRA